MSDAPERPLDPQWAVWVADNRLKGCAVEVMVRTMCDAGIDPVVARRAVAGIESDPGFIAARKQQQIRRKHDSVMAHLFRLQQLRAGASRIERVATIETAAFLEHYYFASRPLILTGFAQQWPALQRWTFPYLREQYGAAQVEVQTGRNSDPDYEMNSLRHKHTMRLRDFIDGIETGGPSNDVYMTANNHALERPELAPLLRDIGPLPSDWFDPGRLARQALLWIGPRGVVTPLHHDTVQLMHTHIVGRKRWRFVSPLQTPLLHNHVGVFSQIRLDQPNAVRYPLPPEVQVIDEVLAPGETLFLPAGWWHHVESLDNCISLSFTNFRFPNEWTFENPDIRDW